MLTFMYICKTETGDVKMKITYYGTAAAEAMPAFFCCCDHCERARKAGGKNIRTRSQALINDDLLIDFPADTYMHIINYGLDLRDIENILITHSHMDHLCPADLQNIRPPYAVRKPGAGPVKVYSSHASSAAFLPELVRTSTLGGNYIQPVTLTPFVPAQIGRYTVTPLRANHDEKICPLIYVISDGEKTMLYGNDTGWFLDETWAYLEENKIRFDFVSLDCTCTRDENPYPNGHMNIIADTKVKEKMLEIGCADEKTVFCMHHFSHNGGYTYDELVPVAKELGFLVSYDSMEFEF